MNKINCKSSLKKNIPVITIIFIIAVCFFVSIILYKVKDYGKRRTFIFPSVDAGNYIVETRYLEKNPVKSDISYYIDEMLLGSGIERTKLLFTAGTKNLSCFERSKVVYLNLSEDLLKMGDNVVDIEEGINLLAKNVFQNFSDINEIDIFIGNKFAYKKTKLKNLNE